MLRSLARHRNHLQIISQELLLDSWTFSTRSCQACSLYLKPRADSQGTHYLPVLHQVAVRKLGHTQRWSHVAEGSRAWGTGAGHTGSECWLCHRPALSPWTSVWPTPAHLLLCKRQQVIVPKVHLIKAMVFPVVMYGCETWTIKKAEGWLIDALNCGVGEDSWESLGQQGDSTSPS